MITLKPQKVPARERRAEQLPAHRACFSSRTGAEMDWLSLTLTSVLILVLYVIRLSQLRKKRIPKDAKLPPVPPATPLIGHTEYHQQHFFATTAMEWAKSYGHTFRVKVGFTELVIVNDYDAIERLFARDELLYRSKAWRLYGLSVGYPMSLEGDAWVQNRRFCIRALRDIGFAKPSIDGDIVDECHRLIARISESAGQPIAVEKLILPSVSNNTVAPVFGESYPFDHPKRKWLDDTLRNLSVAVNKTRRITPVSFLKGPLLSSIAFPGRQNIQKYFRALGDFTRNEIFDRESRGTKTSRTLIDAYFEEMAAHKNDPHSHFTVENLMSTAIGFFQAGSAGVPTFMHWHMLHFALRADTLQAEVQAEIDHVIGPDRRPVWEDRRKMPLTMAVLWEMLRWKSITPLSVPRRAEVDFVCDGFFFPAGITVMANYWAVHNDPNVWPNPEKFDPSRFINDDGSAILEKHKRLIPFSLGKRKCPAETQAIMVLFLYITCILQHFRVLPEEGVTIDPGDAIDRLPNKAKYKLRFIPRKN
ncbi:hypothetical protein V5799_034226 [Amblyomma americanum]|uniref:Cytochrome n=1 Tax=Amblyomma americanum TaxID=6943 RepID=A0AAQ4DL25_AMBAM